MPRYDVVSELNARYLKTYDPADYYGVYSVVRRDDLGHIERTTHIISGKYGSAQAREEAYRIAGRLDRKRRAQR